MSGQNHQGPENQQGSVTMQGQGSHGGSSASESSGSSTRDQIAQINSRLDTHEKNQLDIMDMLKQLTVSRESNDNSAKENQTGNSKLNSKAAQEKGGTQSQGQDLPLQTMPEITTNQLLFMMHTSQRETRFMQASALLKSLRGDEGRTQVEAYFRNFESMTYGWSQDYRAHLLATHLIGPAKLAYESISPD